MVVLARISAILVVVLVLAMVLPGLFGRASSVRNPTPILYYSPVLERFVMQAENGGGIDEQGNFLPSRQYTRSLPFLYHTTLVKWNEFPHSVNGVPVTPRQASRQLQFVRISPRDINVPAFGLHMLLESEPEGASVALAEDMFRLGDGIEFLRCETNSVDSVKSERFTKAMREAGVVFPVRAIGGEPDPRKSFDWGYFLIDDTGMLFHLRMVHGAPSCINTGRRLEQPVRAIFVREHEQKEFYCVIVTQSDVFVVFCNDYGLTRLPLDSYDPDRDVVMLLTTPLNRVVQLRTEEEVQGIALDSLWKPVHQYILQVDRTSKVRQAKLASLLFPFTLETRAALTLFKPLTVRDFYAWPLWTLTGVFVCMGLYVAVHRKRFKRNPPLWELALLGFTGVYGLIALIAVGRGDR